MTPYVQHVRLQTEATLVHVGEYSSRLLGWTSSRWGEAMAMRDILFRKSPKRERMPCQSVSTNPGYR